MNRSYSVALGFLLVAILFLGPAQVNAGASGPGASPYSSSVLTAQSLHAGALRPMSEGISQKSPVASLTCSPSPCVLSNVRASEGGQPVNENPIAVNPRNHSQVMTGGNDYNCASLQGFYNSNDGGSTWKSTCMSTLPGYFGSGDPGVGYDLKGNAYATGIDCTTSKCTSGSIVFVKSKNNGASWSAPAVAVAPLLGGLTDKDWLQVDDSASSPRANALYISVTQFSPSSNSEISVSHSYDGGTTWNTVVVDTQQFYPNVDQFSDLAIAKNGTVFVSWLRCTAGGTYCGGTLASIMTAHSSDGGNTWSAPVVVARVTLAPNSTGQCFYGCLPNTSERVSNIPALDVDRSSGKFAGHLYVLFYNWTGSFMQMEVSRSSDGGKTWLAPVKVATKTDKHDQFYGWLTVSASGKVGVSWLDRRNDPSNISYQAFAAVSGNGGISFSKNVQLTNTTSNPFNDGFGGRFMGDYTGNIWVGNTLYVSWMDSRSAVNMQDEVGGYIT